MKRTRTGDGNLSPPPLKRKIQSTTTKNAVAGFFTPASQKAPSNVNWRTVGETLLIARVVTATSDGAVEAKTNPRIAAFDLVRGTYPEEEEETDHGPQDSTLIKAKDGRRFARDATDWAWWHPTVPGTLKKWHEQGFRVVLLSNQGGISLKHDPRAKVGDQKRLRDFKEKVAAVFEQLSIPVSLYAATEQDKYRKPRTGMWEVMLADLELDPDNKVDLGASFYVGDAGGRSSHGKTLGDHASSDRDFASNVGISFQTPEEFFLQQEPRAFTRSFNPAAFLLPNSVEKVDGLEWPFKPSENPELVLFCGSPGSGKSTFYWKQLEPHGYIRVNQDLLKTRERCIAVASDYLADGKSVVIDNTNADAEIRGKWVQLAKKYHVPVRCVYFTAPPLLCQHNDAVRALNGGRMNPESRTMLPAVAFRSFASRFRMPKLEEGFQEIIRIDFKMKNEWFGANTGYEDFACDRSPNGHNLDMAVSTGFVYNRHDNYMLHGIAKYIERWQLYSLSGDGCRI